MWDLGLDLPPDSSREAGPEVEHPTLSKTRLKLWWEVTGPAGAFALPLPPRGHGAGSQPSGSAQQAASKLSADPGSPALTSDQRANASALTQVGATASQSPVCALCHYQPSPPSASRCLPGSCQPPGTPSSLPARLSFQRGHSENPGQELCLWSADQACIQSLWARLVDGTTISRGHTSC